MTTGPQITALQAIWPTLTPGATIAKLTQLNLLMVAGPTQDVPVATIQPFLVSNVKNNSLQSYVLNTPTFPPPITSALQAANYFWALLQGSDNSTFKAATVPGLLALVPNLGLDSRIGISAANIAAIEAAATPLELWYVFYGWTAPGVSVSDLIAAGGLY